VGLSQSRLAGADFKPPKADVVKGHGGKRLGKVTAVTVAGAAQSQHHLYAGGHPIKNEAR
jgi:hypothetical protein